MLYEAKEQKLQMNNTQIDYITFGKGTKPLIMIQGLNTRGIKCSAVAIAYMYRIFAKDYKGYLFDRRPDLVNKLVLAVTLSKNNDTVKSVVDNWIEMTKQGDMKSLVADMAIKMYSDAYVKRYRLFMPLLTILQKPKIDFGGNYEYTYFRN